MKHYLDITLLPDAEATLGFLWQKVYQQIHIALADNKIADDVSAIAISFPKYGSKDLPLGHQIRLIATESQLLKLDITKWLRRLTDYVHIKSVEPVPDGITQFACFTRKQVKGVKSLEKSLIRKAHHQSTKFGLNFDECLKSMQQKDVKADDKLPFIWVQSLSSQNDNAQLARTKFPLFIDMEIKDSATEGDMNCYGLSFAVTGKTATVPWFQ
jgi:CRISPR-associated endonuclease Csy4